ncbi:MAG TPA: glycosyltransferase [Vicinamibacteria bacterium]|nr:glycosyltransferase [Vicinamibacteria bacterium]
MTPRVSVLLPVRDAAATLPYALASLRAQSLEEYEVVAVLDGSRDASDAILADAARADARIRALRTPPAGLVAALNRAAEAARAPLLARFDADDLARPERLELQVERLARDPGVDVLGSRVALLAAPGLQNTGMRAYVDWQNGLLDHAAIVADLYVESPLVHPSVALRATLLRELGGYRDTGGPEDYDLWLRAHARGARFAKCPETLLDWRDRADRLTRSDARYAPQRFFEAKLAALVGGPLAGSRPVVVWGAGKVGKAWGRRLRASGRVLAAFVEVDPRKLGQRIHGAPVVAVAFADRFPAALHLLAVGQPGARARIRREAAGLGLDLRDVIAVA